MSLHELASQRPGALVRTIRRDGSWTNEIDGERVTRGHRTKDEAATVGREIALALGATHVIHNIDGSVRSRTQPPVGPLVDPAADRPAA